MRKQLETLLPDSTKANLMLKAFGLLKVPLLFATRAHVVDIDDHSCSIKMPFSKVVKNHLGSVYFGALAIGADAAVGLLASHKIYKLNRKISLVFKSFEAQFLKRAEGPTTFICEEGLLIDQMITDTLASGERVSKVINAYALTNGERVAEFKLELSLKAQS